MDDPLDSAFNFAEDFERMAFDFLDQSIKYLPTIIIAVLIFLGFFVASLLVQQIFSRMEQRIHDHGRNRIFKLAGASSKIIILIIGAVTALGTLGININALIASLGLGGFAIGFALKDALSNLLSGALILIYCPFKIGDTIAVTGCRGVVVDINLRYTTIEDEDKTFLIPNSSLFVNNIEVIKRKENVLK